MAFSVAKLKNTYKEKLYEATHHQFTAELTDGTLCDSRLCTYLVQDSKFFLGFAKVLGRAIQLCDNITAVTTLGRQMGFICSDENTYFDTCLSDFRSNGFDTNMPALPEVQEFLQFLVDLAESDDYARIITALYNFELVYLLWAQPHEKTVGHLQYKHKEWVYLHSGPDFTKWVQFLESEVSRVINAGNFPVISKTMGRVLDLEIQFFDTTYNYRA